MPDLKISQLPVATTPLAGTELVPIVQGGTTDQTTVQAIMTSTVPSGTANGVLYLNGSKVATSGSALVFDGSNLGLGVTPSAWSGITALQITAGGAIASDSSALDINANAYYNAGYKYIRTQAASRYTQTSGAHQWYTAPSGTAGNTISFTQAMTLDASGNLGVGTTSPSYKLSVVGGISVTLSGQGQIWNGATGVYTTWQYNGTSVGDIGTADETFSGGSTADFGITSRAGNLVLGTGSTERARITITGNQIATQPAESAQNTSVTLTVANLQTRIITSNAAVTLTLPTGTSLEGYTSSMATDTAFECTFIATTANAITIAANGNTTVGSLTVAGNTSGTFRFRKTAANTFTVYRVA